MSLEIESAEREAMDARLREGLVAMEHFTRLFLDHIGADYTEPRPGVLDIKAGTGHAELLKKGHLLVFDPSVYPEVEDQNAELLTPASPLFSKMLALAESFGPLGAVRTQRATPYTMFHFHCHLEGLSYEWDSLVTIAVDEDGDPVTDPPTVRELVEGIRDGGGRFEPLKAVPKDIAPVPEAALEAAPRLLKERVAVKLDELAGAVETGLRKTQERLHAYYEQMRDEIRRDEIKLRRRIGELNSKIWYTEDKIRLMRLEKEREVLSNELKESKEKTKRTLEHLALEEQERMAKEAERARPIVKLTLAAATRVVPK